VFPSALEEGRNQVSKINPPTFARRRLPTSNPQDDTQDMSQEENYPNDHTLQIELQPVSHILLPSSRPLK